MLKEAWMSADCTPVSAKDLAAFCDKMTKKSGIKIEYGCDSLLRDDWAVDDLADLDYAKRLRETKR